MADIEHFDHFAFNDPSSPLSRDVKKVGLILEGFFTLLLIDFKLIIDTNV